MILALAAEHGRTRGPDHPAVASPAGQHRHPQSQFRGPDPGEPRRFRLRTLGRGHGRHGGAWTATTAPAPTPTTSTRIANGQCGHRALPAGADTPSNSSAETLRARTMASDVDARRQQCGVLDVRTRPGHAGNPHHPGDPRLPGRPPRAAPGSGPASRTCGSSCLTSPALAVQMPFVDDEHSVERYGHFITGFMAALGLGPETVLLGHSFGSIVASHFAARESRRRLSTDPDQPHRRTRSGGPQRDHDQTRGVLLPGCPPSSPGAWDLPCCATGPIVRVMSVTMAKTKDKDLRRFIHGQHDAYFSAFADRKSLLESFKASVSGNVAEVAGELTPPGTADRRRKRRDRHFCPTSTNSPRPPSGRPPWK